MNDELQKCGRLSEMAWLPEFAARVLKILNGNEEKISSMFVGGCVRDAFLGRTVTDIDIATKHHPDKAMTLLKARDIHVIPTGIDHGTVTAIDNQKRAIEITTLRKDVETDGRRAVIAFSDSWIEDAQRRDFTMNTLLCDSEGQIYDPLEQGLEDLKARRIRFVGDAVRRIDEDVLRILRFFRFQSVFPDSQPDERALEACKKRADKIETLSIERITHEITRIIEADDAPRIFQMMADNNIMPVFWGAKGWHEYLGRLIHFQKEKEDVCRSARLAALAGWDKRFSIDALFKKIRLSKERESKITIYCDCFEALLGDMDIFEAAYRYHKRRASQSLLGQGRGDDYDKIMNWDVPEFPLSGHDVIAAGIKEGAKVGESLKVIEEWWISQKFQPPREECLERLRGMI